MLYSAVFALLAASALVEAQMQYYSYSPVLGSGSGTSYTVTGKGRITAVRVWEVYSGYIRGFQLRYGAVWSNVAGYRSGEVKEIQLFDDEAIVQVSGKYAHYVQTVVFTTNRGRSLYVGQPSGQSFNMYPEHKEAELRILSGRFHGGITSIGAHWAVVDPSAGH